MKGMGVEGQGPRVNDVTLQQSSSVITFKLHCDQMNYLNYTRNWIPDPRRQRWRSGDITGKNPSNITLTLTPRVALLRNVFPL